MVLARRREQRLLEQARREAQGEVSKRWKAWYDSLPDAVKKTQPPPPNSD